MKLQWETPLREALRIAIRKGHYLAGTENVPRLPDHNDVHKHLQWMEKARDYWMKSATPEEVEVVIQSTLNDCCGIETLADLKKDIDSGNYGWRNSESGTEIRNLGILFEIFPKERLEAMGLAG